ANLPDPKNVPFGRGNIAVGGDNYSPTNVVGYASGTCATRICQVLIGKTVSPQRGTGKIDESLIVDEYHIAALHRIGCGRIAQLAGIPKRIEKGIRSERLIKHLIQLALGKHQ